MSFRVNKLAWVATDSVSRSGFSAGAGSRRISALVMHLMPFLVLGESVTSLADSAFSLILSS
jgi:hypothetical protein